MIYVLLPLPFPSVRQESQWARCSVDSAGLLDRMHVAEIVRLESRVTEERAAIESPVYNICTDI